MQSVSDQELLHEVAAALHHAGLPDLASKVIEIARTPDVTLEQGLKPVQDCIDLSIDVGNVDLKAMIALATSMRNASAMTIDDNGNVRLI